MGYGIFGCAVVCGQAMLVRAARAGIPAGGVIGEWHYLHSILGAGPVVCVAIR